MEQGRQGVVAVEWAEAEEREVGAGWGGRRLGLVLRGTVFALIVVR
jgi:hypothetical protein